MKTLAMRTLVALRDDLVHEYACHFEDNFSMLDGLLGGEISRICEALGVVNPTGVFDRVHSGLLSQAHKLIGVIRQKYDPARLPSDLPIEFVYSCSPNAFAIHAPEDGSYAIGVDLKIITAMATIAVAGLNALSCDAAEGIGASQLYVHAVADTINAYFLNAPEAAREEVALALIKAINSNKNLKTFMSDFQRLSFWFVTAHEIAHIVLGHLESADAPLLKDTHNEDCQAKVSTFEHEKEFEADSWALRILLDAVCLNDQARDMMRVYPLVFFSVFDIVNSYCQPQTGIAARLCESHPPPLDRLQRLRELFATTSMAEGSLLTAFYELPDSLQKTKPMLDKVLHHVPKT